MTSAKKININLVIKKEIDLNFQNQFLKWALTYGRYIIILTQIFVLFVFFLRFKLDRDHTDLKESVTQKQAIVESVEDLEIEIKQIQKKISDVATTLTDQKIPLLIIAYLKTSVPSDTSFSNLSLNEEELNFAATSSNLKSFNLLLKKLLESDKFNNITLASISRREDGRIEFKISAKIIKKSFT